MKERTQFSRRQIIRLVGGTTIAGLAVTGQAATGDGDSADEDDADGGENATGPCVGNDYENCPT